MKAKKAILEQPFDVLNDDDVNSAPITILAERLGTNMVTGLTQQAADEILRQVDHSEVFCETILA